MIKLNLIIATITCLSSILCSSLYAQTGTSKLRAGCTKINQGHNLLHLRQVNREGKPTESIEVKLNTFTLSQKIEAKAGNKLLFYKTAAAAENAETEEKPIASGSIPSSNGNYILLFIPNTNKKSASAYNILTIPSDKAPYGSFFFMNYTSHPLYAQIGNKKARIATKKHYNFTFRGGVKNTPVNLFTEPVKGKLQPIRKSRWNIAPNAREFIIVYTDPSGKSTLFKHIMDYEEVRRPQP